MTAKYSLLIPANDELGQPLRVAEAVYHHLVMDLGVTAATIHRGFPYDTLVAWAEESPEMDSTFKQLGVYVGEVANVPVVTVTKAGKQTAAWSMRNPHYRPQTGGEASAVTQAPVAGI